MSVTIRNLEKLNTWREKLSRTSCNNCNMSATLANSFLYPVVSRGNGRVMFVGNTVLPDEHKSSEPFTAQGGMQADKFIQKYLQLSTKNDCYLTNLVKCRGNIEQRVTSKDMRTCGLHLLSEIAMVEPEIVVFLGAQSAKTVLGRQKYKIGRLETFNIGGREYPCYVMNNITAMISSTSMYTEIKRQFTILKEWLAENTEVYKDREVTVTKREQFKREYILVDTKEKLIAMVEDLSKDANLIGIDTETNDLRTWHSKFQIVGMSFAKGKERGYYVPVAHRLDPRNFMGKQPTNLPLDWLKRAVYKILENKPATCWFNVGFDYGVLKASGFDISKIFYRDEHDVPMWHDAWTLWYLIDENISDKDSKDKSYARTLKNGARTFLDRTRKTYAEVTGNESVTFEFVTPEDSLEYAADDAVDTWELTQLFYAKVKKESDAFTAGKLLSQIYPEEMEVALVAMDLNQRGMGFDQRYRTKLKHVLREDRQGLLNKLSELGAPVLSINKDAEIKKNLISMFLDPTFFGRFEEEYGEKFDSVARANLIRFYRQEYKAAITKGTTVLSKWTPDEFDAWMLTLNTTKKVDKLLSTYVETLKVERFVETMSYNVIAGIEPVTGKVKAVYTAGWRVIYGEIVPSWDTPPDPIDAKLVATEMKAYQDIIHGSLKPNGAASGRTSSIDPNLQNLTAEVPERPEKCGHCSVVFDDINSKTDVTQSRWTCTICTEVTKIHMYDARRMYTPHAGYYFAKADWDAQEVSLMAAASGCPVLTRLVQIRDDQSRIVSTCCATAPIKYRKTGVNACPTCKKEDAKFGPDPEGDLHTVTAAKINDTTPQQIFIDMHSKDPLIKIAAKKKRKNAKPVNFGIMYGSGPAGLYTTYRNMGLVDKTFEDAEGDIAAWYELFPGVKAFLDDKKRELKVKRKLVNIYGRVRHTPFVDNTLSALNFLIQGPGANVAKKVMGQLSRHFDGRDVYITNLIHDEVVLEYRLVDEREMAQAMYDYMNVVAPGVVPVRLTAEPELRVKTLSKGEKVHTIKLEKAA